MRRLRLPAILAVLILCAFSVQGEERPGALLPRQPAWLGSWDIASPGALSAASAILLDAESGTVLYEKEPDRVIPPASLTKLMTVHLALLAAEEGRFPLQERFEVPESAWAQNQAPGSSLMFLGPGQQVSGEELLYGLGVTSGNDAAVAVSILIEGSVDAFVDRMNREARRLGYETLTFYDPAGLSERNRSTARELADFAEYLIRRHPGILDYFALPSFTYPQRENLLPGHQERSITQWNRNTLLDGYPGADGFKTGFIEASQYNLIATAQRSERRLLVVLLGVPGVSHAEGGRRRSEEAARLFDHGYEHFELVTPATPELEPLRVYGSPLDRIDLTAAAGGPLTLPVGAANLLQGRVTLPEYRWAPLEAGSAVGMLEYTLRGERLLAREVLTRQAADEDNFLGRMFDRLVYLTRPLTDVY